MEAIILVAIFAAFVLSASCGMGGSLIMIPVLCLYFGVKEGVMLSALLLAINNILKIGFYYKDIRLRPIYILLLTIGVGSLLGALFMLKINSTVLSVIMVVFLVMSFVFYKYSPVFSNRAFGAIASFLAGFASGLSGVSGPLKGMAIRNFVSGKASVVAAAACISFVMDAIKAAVFATSATVYQEHVGFILVGMGMMPLATYLGRLLNQKMSLMAYDTLFYLVISGYVVRMMF